MPDSATSDSAVAVEKPGSTDTLNNTDSISSRSITGVREEPLSVFDENAPDWRIWFGLVVTVFWLIMLSAYVSRTVGWSNIGNAPIATVGNFLEGAFAPLAFLWLVIGYFLQKKELTQNTAAIKMQYVEIQKSATQAAIQSEIIQASEVHARRESLLRIADNVKEQLGAIMGFLFISSQGASGSGAVSPERQARLFNQLSQDPEIFSRQMMEIYFLKGPIYAYKVFFGTAVRTRHSESFIFSFERLLKATRQSDSDDMITDAILGSAHGYIYQRMISIRDDPPPGIQPGVYDFDPDSDD